MEIWKDIPNYEGLYQVSNLGRVKSLRYRKQNKEKILCEWYDKRGYKKVELLNKAFSVHRLVAITWIDNINNKETVNHINENKSDNRVENLEWMTNSENINHGSRNERVANILKKPVLMLNSNGEIVKEFSCLKETELHGYNRSIVSRCCNGFIKTHRGFIWKFKSNMGY